jgi:sarcosine oxidase, subunit alpha
MPRLPEFPDDCSISFDGQLVRARAGESVASALLAAGRPLVSRSAKYHRPRGPFCLAGSCGMCLVRAGGLPNQRACRTPCRDGLSVETQNAIPDARHDLLGLIDRVYPHGLDHHHLMTGSVLLNRATVAFSRKLAGLGTLAPAGAVKPAPGPVAEERWDALVVGAGPAGLAAAEALADGGRRVLLAESEPRAGGRLRARLDLPGDPDLAWAQRVLARVAATGGEVALSTTVLGLWIDHDTPLAALRTDASPVARMRLVRPARVVLANGGAAQPPPLEDGDRPGVFAARGLLAALAEDGVIPGSAAAVLGDGPEAARAAERLRAAGVDVPPLPEGASASEGRVLGRGRVRGYRSARGLVRCDVIAIATPPAPATELGRALGAEVFLETGCGAFALRAGGDGRTGVANLFAAGEVTGAQPAAAAAEHGRLAGEAARG